MTKKELLNFINELPSDKDIVLSISGSEKYPYLRFYIENIEDFTEVIESDYNGNCNIIVDAESNEDFDTDE